MKTRQRRIGWTLRLLAVAAAVMLVAAACGDDGDTEDTSADTSTGTSGDAGTGGSTEDAASTESEPSGPQPGSELRVVRGLFHEGWDPDNALELGSIQYIQHVMEPLIRANPDGQTLSPGLADSWEYDDEALTFSVTLNPDATFSDGTPVTSADVAFSVEEWKAGPNYGILYAAIDTTEIVDDHSLVFSMGYPDSSLEAVLTWQSAAIMPLDYGGMSREE